MIVMEVEFGGAAKHLTMPRRTAPAAKNCAVQKASSAEIKKLVYLLRNLSYSFLSLRSGLR